VFFKPEQISQVVAETLVKASTSFRPDQLERYRLAFQQEQNPQARWVIEKIVENAEVGQQKRLPMCDDTGIPHVFLEIGDEAVLPAGFFAAIDDGIAAGLRALPGRPMAVKGDDVQRITQSAGLYDRSDRLLPAPLQMRRLPGDQIKLTILMLGGGPEIRGKTQRVFHQHTLDVVLNEMVAWALDGAAKLGCLPCVLFFGIGRTNVEAASLALEAMKDCNFLQQSEIEQRITEAVNQSKIGPLGIGGQTTALATFVKVGPQRASGVRVVSLRVGCCIDPRKATYVWEE
jgi:fumarate hydratase subunit alpha